MSEAAHAQVDQRWRAKRAPCRLVRIRYISSAQVNGKTYITVDPIGHGWVRTMTLDHLYRRYELVAE